MANRDSYGDLTREQRALLNEVVSTAYESHEDVGHILDRLPGAREDKRAVSDTLAEVRP